MTIFAHQFLVNMPEKVEERTKKKMQLYDYQKLAIDNIFSSLDKKRENYNILFQLPTGGGKTVIFSEIARRFIEERKKKVLILTHRIELCNQTSVMLDQFDVDNKVINSKIKELPDQRKYDCFVAMVETLNNRLNDELFEVESIGLIIVDEAHYNSFRKLFKFFEKSTILGVTATPLSSNIKLPLHDNYAELIVGDSINTLIDAQYLAKGNTYSYDVNLKSLKVGINGDYTVSSSEKLYGNYMMQEKLLYAYEEKAKGTKTLIFNNGINTSKQVYEMFKDAGYDIRHLDNTHSEQDRKDILKWFKTKSDAILSSVSILTTGFDEPEVGTIILNRATKSLTLYHQMIGRGSRVIGDKKEFNIIDLGNNARRFGLWESYIDWQEIFINPNSYIDGLYSDEEIEKEFTYEMPQNVKARFPNTEDHDAFNIKKEYAKVMAEGDRPKLVLDRAIQQHRGMILENSEDFFDAKELVELLEQDIEYRVKNYSYCISKSTESFIRWLKDDYKRKLTLEIRREYGYA